MTDATEMERQLRSAFAGKGPGYVPRTRHREADGSPRFTNRLILSASPYLLQHAHNPVQWFPWGEEAFARARELSRPVFLSVGYATCHWCHVMEEESFEDEEIAGVLNEHYVAVKVDREERPDVDAVYMTFVQALTGHGGWPMSVWLTPKQEPFFGGTYFPPRAGVRGAPWGFVDLLLEQARLFASRPDALAARAAEVVAHLRAATAPGPSGSLPGPSLIEAALREAAQVFDPVWGGRRGAPKFPSSFPLRLLLRAACRTGEEGSRRMVRVTLERMRAGGIYDQLGGGFHRYATDARWQVPHFEKMLYDNAQLALTYLEAAQTLDEPAFADTTRDILDYLLRDMMAADGTFFSATDADSPAPDGRREEGLWLTWTPAELRAALGPDDAQWAAAIYGVTEPGNFEGRSILTRERDLAGVARELGIEPQELASRLPGIRARLLEARAARPPPSTDDKVIVSWNALAISALARAALVLGEARYADAALRAGRALVAPVRAGGALPHVLLDGRARGNAFADDLALLAGALLDLFELDPDPAWLNDARRLMAELDRTFADGENGGYFLSGSLHERLVLRDKPAYDGPLPCPSSAAALTWSRLHALTGEDHPRLRAEATLRAFAEPLTERPLALEVMLCALELATHAAEQLLVVVPEGRGALCADARPMLDVLEHTFAPNAAIVIASETELAGALGEALPWARGKVLRNGRPTAYLCRAGACELPTSDPAVLAAQLSRTRPTA